MDINELETKEQVFQFLRVQISKHLEVSESEITLGSHFAQDLGLDSMDQIELILVLEGIFGKKISDIEDEKIKTINHTVNFIFDKLINPKKKRLN